MKAELLNAASWNGRGKLNGVPSTNQLHGNGGQLKVRDVSSKGLRQETA